MSDQTPLTPEQIDLLLSADLDGEFDAAATDLGLDAATARAQLDTTPSATVRREQLAAARDLLAEPIEIDELLAARLRTKAVKAGADAAEEQRHVQRTSRTRVFGIISGVAAALLVVVALGAMLRTTESSSKSSDTASGAPTEGAPSPTPSTIATRAGANNAAKQQLALSPTYLSLDALEDDVRQKSAAFAVGARAVSGSDNFSSADSGSSAYACVPAAERLAAGDQPLANGTTEVAGRPLTVLLYGNEDGRTALVFDRDCKLVNQQLIH